MLDDHLPIFGICGYSGAGKTTLIEQLIARFQARGLHVAVAKHDTHGIDIDRPGKDSDRFFQAGADVLLCAPDQDVLRSHRQATQSIMHQLMELAAQCDVLLVEGRKHTPLPKIWLLKDGENAPPSDVGNILASLSRDVDRVAVAERMVEDLILRQSLATPVFGGILIGGRSSRMGRPKHLIVNGQGQTWLRHTIDIMASACSRIVILGAGKLPEDVSDDIARVPDIPGLRGPISGVLAAMRWAPHVSWLLAPCDLPHLTEKAPQWLLATRAPGRWASIPQLANAADCEALPAHYDWRCRLPLEAMVGEGGFSLAEIARHPKASVITVPAELAGNWTNCNEL